MNLSFVALDLETTGLSETAEIIEIGMCKVSNGQISEYFSSLVRPSQIIPTEITLLTGIDQRMVKDAPPWHEIESAVKNFIGDATLVAHNISFDRTILENHFGGATKNDWIDTHDLAKIFLPSLTSYKLIALLQALNIDQSQHHRALADAEGCALVFLDILKIAKQANPFTLQKIYDIFSEDICGLSTLLAQLCGESVGKTSHDFTYCSENFSATDHAKKPSLTFHHAEKFFSANGIMSQAREDFQYRPQQIEMLHTISDAFLYQKHAIIEAGTGTGKSFAYLLPALLWAYENQKRVVISTNTIARTALS